jgi:hypothetical protein
MPAPRGSRFQRPRAVIDEADFRDLVDGRIITLTTREGRIDVALADIGFERMLQAIAHAQGIGPIVFERMLQARGDDDDDDC